MDVRNDSRALDTLLLQMLQKHQNATAKTPEATAAPALQKAQKQADISRQDKISLSGDTPDKGNQNKFSPKATRLVSENIQPLDNGFRRLQEYETSEGRHFTRTEEVTTENDRSKRTVIQQSTSGNTSVLENILDRQADGTFRLTQRYTDETGETSTNIKLQVTPDNVDIILGRPPAPEQDDSPFKISRGTQFDVTA